MEDVHTQEELDLAEENYDEFDGDEFNLDGFEDDEFDDNGEASDVLEQLQSQPQTLRPNFGDHSEEFGQRLLEKLLHLLQKDDAGDFRDIWQTYHSNTNNAVEVQAVYGTQFLDYVTKHRSMTFLTMSCFKDKHLSTLYDVWRRFPDAHREEVKAIDWVEVEKVISFDELGEGLSHLIPQIQERAHNGSGEESDLSQNLLDKLVYPVIRRYVAVLDQKHYLKFLESLKDPFLYEDFLGIMTRKRQRTNADNLYKAYRKLPGVKIRGHIMFKMVMYIYLPINAAGIELLMEDMYARWGRLPIFAYRRFMEAYARLGDVKTVERLWEEYTREYAEERKRKPHHDRPLSNSPDFVPLLHVYAIRGQLGEVRRLFSSFQTIYGPALNILCWNILLNAHAKAREYDAAVRVFGVLRQAVTPDKYSYGTMMGMSGSRGDLEFTLDLYRMAKNEGIEPNVAMVDCVVEAYCQNDKFDNAENICTMTTNSQRFTPEETTTLWNSLLNHHAQHRDLTAINRILGIMTAENIPYNSDTYSCLLRGLVLCRQPHHALYLIQEAVKNHSFKPTMEHYALLMGSFIRSGQPGEALRTSTILRSLGLPQTGDVLLRVLQALGGWASRPPHGVFDPDKQKSYLVSALRQFRASIEWSNRPRKIRLKRRNVEEPWIEPSASPHSTVSTVTDQARTMIFIFTQMREIATVPEILELWRSSSPETSNMQQLPLKLMDALMLAAFHDGKYDEAEKIWNMAYDRTKQLSQVSAPGTTRDESLPSMRYILNNGLRTMLRIYAIKEDPEGLRAVVSSVLQAGFHLDSKNWNYYVQILASMKKWREAFVVCEEQLMPSWYGWQSSRAQMSGGRTQLPLEIRQRGMDPHRRRPISYTLLVLSKSFMDLEQMAAWSTEAERLLNYIMEKCPSCVAAIKTQLRTNSALEERIFMGGDRAQLEDDAYRERNQELEQKYWDEDAADNSTFEGGDEEWYDVHEEDDENWTPMRLNQKPRNHAPMASGATRSNSNFGHAPLTKEIEEREDAPMRLNQKPQDHVSKASSATKSIKRRSFIQRRPPRLDTLPQPVDSNFGHAPLTKEKEEQPAAILATVPPDMNAGGATNSPSTQRTKSKGKSKGGAGKKAKVKKDEDDVFYDSEGRRVEGFGGDDGEGSHGEASF